MTNPPFNVIDLFCGTGGFSKGLEKSGAFKIVAGIDLLAEAVGTFRLNHPDALALNANICSLSPEAASSQLQLRGESVDVIVGGPPCQGFSSIRPHRSTDWEDPRNSLFNEFALYVEYFRPVAFILENVVGLATYKTGSYIAAIEDTFSKVGYETDWRILNAAHYGIPQKRERLILLGIEQGSQLNFPPPTHGGGKGTLRTIGVRDRDRMHGIEQESLLDPNPNTVTNLKPVVTLADAIDDLPPIASGEKATEYGSAPRTYYQRERRGDANKLTLHASTRHSERMLEIIRHAGPNISSIPTHLISSGFSSCYSRLALDEPSVTITVNFVHPASNRCIHPTLDRALTPREGARLQSFDDDFKFAGTRAQIVKQIGNAVPPLLGQHLGTHLANLLGAQHETSLAA
jgi:DNA (cytosine-5)-methyltransferase 1